jgi:hypothetical protein
MLLGSSIAEKLNLMADMYRRNPAHVAAVSVDCWCRLIRM